MELDINLLIASGAAAVGGIAIGLIIGILRGHKAKEVLREQMAVSEQALNEQLVDSQSDVQSSVGRITTREGKVPGEGPPDAETGTATVQSHQSVHYACKMTIRACTPSTGSARANTNSRYNC